MSRDDQQDDQQDGQQATAELFGLTAEMPPGSTDPLADESDDDLDSDFAPAPRRRLGTLSVTLAALLVAGVGFLAGVLVQRNQTPASTSAASFASRAAGAARGAGTGGFGAGGLGGATGSAGASSSATGSATAPAVIGTIVSVQGDRLVVKNFGGQLVTVTLSSTTSVTKTSTTAQLATGQTVSVTGSAGSDGSVTASAVNAQ